MIADPANCKEATMKYVLSLILLLTPVSAIAADATQPVKAIMDLAKEIWTPGANSDDNYFDVAHLKLFSSEFAKTYHEAEKHPAYDSDTGVGYPFEYDVIVGGQDSCELQDIKMTAGEAVDGNTPVLVTFKGQSCMGGELAEDLTHLTFVVTEENGKQVIDDIIREGDDTQETTNSLRDEMDRIIEGQ